MQQDGLPDFLANGMPHWGRRAMRKGGTPAIQAMALGGVCCNAILAIAGIVILMSSASLHDASRLTGLVLGLSSALAGMVGSVGNLSRTPSLIILGGLSALIGIMLSFIYLEQVQAGVKTDCAIAELMLRSEGAERHANEMKMTHRDLFDAVYVRLNELESVADLKHETVDKHIRARHEQHKLKEWDSKYIIERLESLAQHAQVLQDTVLKAEHINATLINSIGPGEKQELIRRLKTADYVLERIDQHKQAANPHHSVEYNEFEEFVSLLLDEHQHPSTHAPAMDTTMLHQTAEDLPSLQGALHRVKENEYHQLDVDGLMTELAAHQQALEEEQSKKRSNFNQKFQNILHYRLMRTHNNFLQDLPQHCAQESSWARFHTSAGVSSLLLSIASSYIAFNLIYSLPAKRD